jgi:hypothetical protein
MGHRTAAFRDFEPVVRIAKVRVPSYFSSNPHERHDGIFPVFYGKIGTGHIRSDICRFRMFFQIVDGVDMMAENRGFSDDTVPDAKIPEYRASE